MEGLAVCLFFALLCHVSCTTLDDGLRRFEYRHSFKGPALADKQGRVPCWTYQDSAMASSEQLRLTPSIRSRSGMAWNKFEYAKEWFEIEMTFRVSGRGRTGADGLALWFTEQKGTTGPVFGSSDYWNGLGVFFDSFDNDGGQNNPHIVMIQNDGTKQYDHSSDGATQAIGGCMRDFRNRPFAPRAKLTYYLNELTLYYDHGTSQQPNYELCARAAGIKLPPEGYFGLSSATGGLADDHDVLSFLVSSIRVPGTDQEHDKDAAGTDVNPEQQQQYEQDYEKRSDELQQQKDAYYKEHPDKRPMEDLEAWDTKYESPSDMMLRQILEAQTNMKGLLTRIQQQVSAQSGAAIRGPGQPQQLQQQGGQHQLGTANVAQLNEMQSKLQVISQEQNSAVRMLQEIHTKSGKVDGVKPGLGGDSDASTQQDIYQLQNAVSELKSNVGSVVTLMQSLERTIQQSRSGGSGDGSSNCITTTMFIVICTVQLAVTLGLVLWSGRQKKAQEKKFF